MQQKSLFGFGVNPGVMTDIKSAAKDKRLLEIEYMDGKGVASIRDIEVYEIKGEKLYAWDVGKDDHIRMFNIDRIRRTHVLPDRFTPKWPIQIT